MECFNPCFAGRPSPTRRGGAGGTALRSVSILVLLEDPRQLDCLNSQFLAFGIVSILVLLEDPRQRRAGIIHGDLH